VSALLGCGTFSHAAAQLAHWSSLGHWARQLASGLRADVVAAAFGLARALTVAARTAVTRAAVNLMLLVCFVVESRRAEASWTILEDVITRKLQWLQHKRV